MTAGAVSAGAERRLDECLSVRGGRLVMENCDLGTLARRFGTPLHVISEDQLRRRARAFAEVFGEAWPHGPVRILPSIKANFALALRAVLTDEGLGCDAFGPGELEAALRCGTDPGTISLNGTGKDRALLERGIAAGVRVTVDSLRELELAGAVAGELGTRARVRVRVRPDLGAVRAPSDLFEEPVPAGDAVARYKPGIPTEELLEAGPLLRAMPQLELSGAMMHLGRHRADLGFWRQGVRAFVRVLAALRDAWDGWEPGELDVGGGLPVPRDPTGRAVSGRFERAAPPPLRAHARAIAGTLAAELGHAGMDPSGRVLEVEPGRALYGDAGVHLMRVVNIKRQRRPQPRTWVETDTSEAFLPDGLLERNRWEVLAADRADAPAGDVCDLVGRSCTFDVLVADAVLPSLRPGEVLAALDTGAYQDAAASNFNAMPRPGMVMVSGDRAEVVRRPETLEDVFARDVIPERLRAC